MADGNIEVISGCMFAGKTEELLRRLRRTDIAGREIEVFTPEIDDRFERDSIGSHNGREWESTVIADSKEGQKQLYSIGSTADVVAIDEFNFLSKEFIDVAQELADSGARVIISGTDQTFRGESFEPMGSLLAVADDVTKLTAVCEVCGQKATRNQRLINGEPAPEDSPTVLVGGEDSYEARCRDCHQVPSSGESEATSTSRVEMD